MQRITKNTYVFSKDAEPVAHAQDGEVLNFITADCFDGQVASESDLVESVDYDHCNPAAGPVFVEGAEPGDVLAVEILSIDVAKTGFSTTHGEGGLPLTMTVDVADDERSCVETLTGPAWPETEVRTRAFNVENGYVTFNDIKWKADPMIGVMGTAPAGDDIPTGHLGNHGGNLDSPTYRAGSTVYLPVRVPGALLAMGDVHATMADGEANGTGIEIAADIIVRVHVIKNFELNWPVVETPDDWFVCACGPNCDKAIDNAYQEMHRLLVNAYGWDYTDVSVYMSVQGSLCANQCCMEMTIGGNSFRVGTPKVTTKPPLVG